MPFEPGLLLLEALSKHRNVAKWTAIISVILFGISISLNAVCYAWGPEIPTVKAITNLVQGVAILSLIAGTLCLLSFGYPPENSINRAEAKEQTVLHAENEALKKRLQEGSASENVLTTIQLSLNQVAEYYTINKGQARNSFRASVFAVVVGLIALLAGGWMLFRSNTEHPQIAAITGIGGTLAEFIGVAYFYLYSKSITQLNFFYERLLALQSTMLAIKLIEQEEDSAQRGLLRRQLITELMARGATERRLKAPSET